MSEQLKLTKQNLDQLQRLRASVVAFQAMIAPLSASQRDNSYNEQFNQLRRQTQAVISTQQFEKNVPPVTTEATLQGRQGSVIRNIMLVVVLGIMLAMVGLGINAIILEDFVINTIGCCISSAGMFLVMGSFALLGVSNNQRRVSNLGELYQRCNSLLYQIDHTLNLAMPELANRPQVTDTPPMPSVLELAMDSLNKQAVDWQQKLQALQEQQARLEPSVPLVITVNIDFVQRELERVKQEIERLHGQFQLASKNQPTLPPMPVAESNAVKEIVLPGGRKIALSKVDEPLMPPPMPIMNPAIEPELPLPEAEAEWEQVTPTEDEATVGTVPITETHDNKASLQKSTRPNQPVSHEEILRLAQQGNMAHNATMAMPLNDDETMPLGGQVDLTK